MESLSNKVINIFEKLIYGNQLYLEEICKDLYDEYYKISPIFDIFLKELIYFCEECKKFLLNDLNKRSQNFIQFIKYFSKWIKTNEQYFCETSQKKTPLSEEIPWLNFLAIDYLEDILKKDFSVFEFGCGGSTIYFGKRVKEVVSVEHDMKWFDEVKNKINKSGLSKKCDLYLISAELFKNEISNDLSCLDSYVSSDKNYKGYSFKKYATFIDNYPKDYFDLILIDGRARPSCFKHAFDKVKDEGFIILDNSEREHYKIIHELLNKVGWEG